MRVAIVHDWLTGMRGGEAVLESLCRLLPGAPIHTLVHVRGSVSATIEAHPIRTSLIQRLPAAATRYRHYLPLFPLAIEHFDLRGFDRVVSSSHCVAKGVIPAPGARHLCYCHTPVRYAWDRYDDYFGPGSGAGLFQRAVALPTCHYLRLWDAASASRVDRFLANSRFVAGRIRRYYRRESEVLHPPVDCSRFAPDPRGPEDYYLVVSALAPYKRVDHAIRACAAAGRRLVVVGTGPLRRDLERLARREGGGRIELAGHVGDRDLAGLYARCRALLFPGVEDFGITPLESFASGRPVIALDEGGAPETVEGAPGCLVYHDPTPHGLSEAMARFEREALDRVDPQGLRERALALDRPVFEARLAAALRQEGIPVALPAPASAAGLARAEVATRR